MDYVKLGDGLECSHGLPRIFSRPGPLRNNVIRGFSVIFPFDLAVQAMNFYPWTWRLAVLEESVKSRQKKHG